MLPTTEMLWIKPLFDQRSWELLYLDPSLMNLAKRRRARLGRLWYRFTHWISQRPPETFWRVTSAGDAMRKIGELINQNFQYDAADYFVEQRLAQKIVNDRRIQREAVEHLTTALQQMRNKTALVTYTSVADLRRSLIKPDGDRDELESLVLIEAPIGRRAELPTSLAKELPPYTRNNREICYYLSDRPFYFLQADDPFVGLQIDTRVLFQISRDLDRFLVAGWYPQARVLGHYCTLVGGITYIDVLAIFLRQFPPIDSLLFPLNELADQFGFCHTMHQMPTVLEEIQKEFRAQWDKQAKNPPGATVSPSNGWSREQEEFRRRQHEADEILLSPLLWLSLCCKVNGLEVNSLSNKAKPLFDSISEFGKVLLPWCTELKKHDADSILVKSPERIIDDKITTLLAPPK